MKTVHDLYAEHQTNWKAEYDRYHREMKKAIARDFPAGTKVKFMWGAGYVHATVVGPARFSDDKIVVKNIKSKAEREIEAFHVYKE